MLFVYGTLSKINLLYGESGIDSALINEVRLQMQSEHDCVERPTVRPRSGSNPDTDKRILSRLLSTVLNWKECYKRFHSAELNYFQAKACSGDGYHWAGSVVDLRLGV